MKTSALAWTWYVSLFTIGLFCLTSCIFTGKKQQVDSKEVSLTPQGEKSIPIDFAQIAAWNKKRHQKDTLISTFELASNTFSFTIDSLVDQALHAYIGIQGDTLSFTLVPKDRDSKQNSTCISIATLKPGPKTALPKFKPHKENSDSIAWSEASLRIQKWNDSTSRNRWVRNQFNGTSDTLGLFQAFVIHSKDIAYGQAHDCYLALKRSMLNPSAYVVDLIIVNSKTQKILNFEWNPIDVHQNLEDMTAPIPPFKPNGSMAQNEFGVLESLNIN